MTFYYHMFGSTMSCVIIYVRNQNENRIKPVWLKSENKGDQWIREQISLNKTGQYKVGYVVMILHPRNINSIKIVNNS